MKDKTKWSYLAGIIDGEGCLSIWHGTLRENNGRVREEGYEYFKARVYITNTNYDLMKWLIKNFGGNFTSKPGNEKHKTSYIWRPKGKKNTEELLLGVLPYLVLKAEQANLVLQFIRLEGQVPEQRRDLMNRCQLLNKKGSSPTTNTSNSPETGLKIESELAGDRESEPVVKRDEFNLEDAVKHHYDIMAVANYIFSKT